MVVTRRERFVALAKEEKRVQDANALEHSRAWEPEDEKRARDEGRVGKVRRLRALLQDANFTMPLHLMSTAVGLLVLRWVLINGGWA